MTHVPANQIDLHWPRVRRGLERIIAKYHPAWVPEHVYVALANKTSFLTIFDTCFAVWSVTPGDDGRGLMFVWAVEGEDYANQRDKVQQALNDIAKQMNVRAIRMIGRKGWGRDPFWTPAGYVYEHEVT